MRTFAFERLFPVADREKIPDTAHRRRNNEPNDNALPHIFIF